MDNAPFIGSDAIRDGLLTRTELRRSYRRIYRDVYIARNTDVDACTRARAAYLFADRKAVVAGASAAALHGSRWISPDHVAELIWPDHRRSYPGIRIRFDVLLPGELETRDGITVTTLARTAFDLGRRGNFPEALEKVDALCNATGLRPATVVALSRNHRGSRGVVQLRRVLDIADAGAESPQESRLRLLLHEAGLPRSTTQIEVRGPDGEVFARIDLGWAQWKVAVEYDGAQHWTDARQRAWDIERTYLLEQLGWTVIRVSARHLWKDRGTLVTRIREALIAAGARL